jgi:hypothetical protein
MKASLVPLEFIILSENFPSWVLSCSTIFSLQHFFLKKTCFLRELFIHFLLCYEELGYLWCFSTHSQASKMVGRASSRISLAGKQISIEYSTILNIENHQLVFFEIAIKLFRSIQFS